MLSFPAIYVWATYYNSVIFSVQLIDNFYLLVIYQVVIESITVIRKVLETRLHSSMIRSQEEKISAGDKKIISSLNLREDDFLAAKNYYLKHFLHSVKAGNPTFCVLILLFLIGKEFVQDNYLGALSHLIEFYRELCFLV